MVMIPSIKTDIDQLKLVADDIKEINVSRSCVEISEKLIQNQFYLVIVGLFKRGKSSLINALIGREIAPVAITPLTSVITFFQYGSVTSAEVHFRNGTNATIDLHDISLYVSEENNPKNIRNVEYVRIRTKAPILENVILVDTPGLGSLFSHNTDTTIEFLPRIDAALFVLSADLPVSKADEEFLLKMAGSINEILFVLNKSDLLTSSELEQMLTYNMKMLRGIFNDEKKAIELIPVSARDFFKKEADINKTDKGNIKLLKDSINSKIIVSKNDIIISRSINVLLSLADQLNTLLSVKHSTLQMPVQELEKKREAMEHSIALLASGKGDFEAVVKNRVDQLTANITEQCEQKRKELEQFYYNLLILNAPAAWENVKSADANIYFQKLADQIIKEYDDLKEILEKSVREEFSSILLQYSTLSRSFLDEIIKQMRDILGINIEGIISSFDLDVYSSFYFKTDTKYSIHSLRTNILYRIIPEKLVRALVLKQVYTGCLELINPNAGRMRGDIDYKIHESYRKFRYHFDQKLYDLLQSLKKMIDESIELKHSFNSGIEIKLKDIEYQQRVIEEIKVHYLDPPQEMN